MDPPLRGGGPPSGSVCCAGDPLASSSCAASVLRSTRSHGIAPWSRAAPAAAPVHIRFGYGSDMVRIRFGYGSVARARQRVAVRVGFRDQAGIVVSNRGQ